MEDLPIYWVAFRRFMSETDREGISTLMRRISPQGLGVLTLPTWRRRRRRRMGKREEEEDKCERGQARQKHLITATVFILMPNLLHPFLPLLLFFHHHPSIDQKRRKKETLTTWTASKKRSKEYLGCSPVSSSSRLCPIASKASTSCLWGGWGMMEKEKEKRGENDE